MAFNQKNKRLGKFLDFIGLVDTEKEDDGNYAGASRSHTSSRPAQRNAAPVQDDMDDLFDETPAPRRQSARSTAPRAASSRYESGDDWMESGRIDYRSQPSSRYSSSRPQAQSRYSSAPSYEEGYRSTRTQSRPQMYDYGMEGERRNPYRQAPARTPAPRVEEMNSEYETYESEPAASSRHQMVVYDLHTVNECKDVILALLAKKSVLVNLVSMNQETAQRALDTLSGATFAISAKISRASDTTWLFTPSNVEVASLQGEEPGRKYY